MRRTLAQMFVHIYETVDVVSTQFFAEQKRKLYVTPASFIDLIKNYVSILNSQRIIIDQKVSRFGNGLVTIQKVS